MTTRATNRATHSVLLDSQRRVLERIASGAPLAETLDTLVRLVEEQAEGMRCAVLLADSAQQSLSFVAAPSIPEDYKTGIAPYLRIAPNNGACGTAAFLREPVYTEDTGTDALWEDCRDIATACAQSGPLRFSETTMPFSERLRCITARRGCHRPNTSN
ncbi:MAG: GAF domain-containing protein [Betaproteobacteria bacterium]|nr:MAG: GAF domain-containing protein [Betaproteobacteria bacterium]